MQDPQVAPCNFPNCAGMAMLKTMADGIGKDIQDIKASITQIPKILEHVAGMVANMDSLRRDLDKAIKEHDEIFKRLRLVEETVTGRRWVDTFKNIFISIVVIVFGAAILALAGWGLYMYVIHMP